MMRYFLHIGYNGIKYHGWQRQPKVISVQQKLEENISKMVGKETVIFGCGRTDAGVHASQYFLHIDVEEAFDYDPVFRLNKMLPDDIAVFEVLLMKDKSHARYDAQWRTYDYFMNAFKDPFLGDRSGHYPFKTYQLKEMAKAVQLLPRIKDFRSVCKSPDIYNHTICEVINAQLLIDPTGDKLRFQITANRFLRGMIRYLVTQLVDIGKGRISVDQFENQLLSREPFEHKHPAYPQGLFLSKVTYPYLDLPRRTDFWMDREKWEAVV